MSLFKMENNCVIIRIWMCGHSFNKYVYLLLMTLKHYFGSKVPAHVEYIIGVGDRLWIESKTSLYHMLKGSEYAVGMAKVGREVGVSGVSCRRLTELSRWHRHWRTSVTVTRLLQRFHLRNIPLVRPQDSLPSFLVFLNLTRSPCSLLLASILVQLSLFCLEFFCAIFWPCKPLCILVRWDSFPSLIEHHLLSDSHWQNWPLSWLTVKHHSFMFVLFISYNIINARAFDELWSGQECGIPHLFSLTTVFNTVDKLVASHLSRRIVTPILATPGITQEAFNQYQSWDSVSEMLN